MCKQTAADGRSRVCIKMLKQSASIEVCWGAARPGKQDTSSAILRNLIFGSVLIIIVDKCEKGPGSEMIMLYIYMC